MELYELKPTRDRVSAVHDRGLTGNSGSSLHAKTFSIDGRKVFIGSLNFDPRSTLLNTEMGFVIESEVLAELIHKRFMQSQREIARNYVLIGGEESIGSTDILAVNKY